MRRLLWVPLLLLSAAPVRAQQLAVRHYDIADGLSHNKINAILQDSRGYVWLSTYDGLSRFDGHRFTSYGERDGLPHAIVHGLAEDTHGRLWIGFFSGGLVRLGESPGQPKFERHAVRSGEQGDTTGGLIPTADGALVVVTSDGIYRSAGTGKDGQVRFTRIHANTRAGWLGAVHRDRRGRVWVGLEGEMQLIDGATVHRWASPEPISADRINGIAEDASGRILAATHQWILEYVERASDGRPGFWRPLMRPDPGTSFTAIRFDKWDRLWIGTTEGLSSLETGGQPSRVAAQGLTGRVTALHEDRDGNLWVGTERSGAFVIGARRLANVAGTEGVPVHKVVEGPDGRIFAVTDDSIREVVDGRAITVPGGHLAAARVGPRFMRDSRGDWWGGPAHALVRIRAPEPRFDKAETVIGPLGSQEAWYGPAPVEGPDGDIWATGSDDHVFRVRPLRDGTVKTETLRMADVTVRAGRMVVDRHGNAWMGSYGLLQRRRADGRYGAIFPHAGVDSVLPRSLMIDSRGWLWVGHRYKGASVTRNPDAEQPAFEHYSTASGLSSDSVWALCEDSRGRVYFGTGRGLDTLDITTGALQHLSVREGLAGAPVNGCLEDSRGRLWVATVQGLSVLNAAADHPSDPPAVYFTRLRVNDDDVAVTERGVATVTGYVLPPSSSGIVAEFVAPSTAQPLRYQYFLEGADTGWSRPSLERSINLARLSAGRYRLLVRAVNEEGRVSAAPAVLAFEVLRPVWLRWWFMLLAAAAAVVAGFALHRVRVRQILALEGVRQQVAMDLHDDIGAGLTQIAIVSELGRQDGGATAALAETATLARSLRESMSDIVWAIDPRKDHLGDLVNRLRQVTYKLLERNGVRVDFTTPPERVLERVEVPPDRRKHLLLLFKETVSNIARHARASHVRIDLTYRPGELRLTAADDGVGFDVQNVQAGHGIGTIQARSEAMGGRLSLLSTPGTGTTIDVVVPL